MGKRIVLLAVWLAFAGLAVAVGFTAVGLVGQPFDEVAGTGPGRVVEPAETASPSPSDRSAAPSTPTASTPTPDRTTGEPGTPTASGPRPDGAVSRTLTTRAGLVSATCRGSALRVGAAPAVGWRVDEVEPEDGGRKVRFESGRARVEVRVTCLGGRPAFAVEDDDSGGDDHGGGDDSGTEGLGARAESWER